MDLELELEVVAEGLGFPEGPVVTRDGTLFFVDISEQVLMRLDPGASAPEVVADLPGGPNGLAIGPDGSGYVCNNGGVFDFDRMPPLAGGEADGRPRGAYLLVPDPVCPGKTYGTAFPCRQGLRDAEGLPAPAGSIQKVDLRSGKVTEVYGPSTGASLIAPDDIVFDAHGPEGSFWFTDCGYQNRQIIRKGQVYAGHVNGAPLAAMADIPSPNGIGFSKDGTTLYVADTLFGRLWALEMDVIRNADQTPLRHAATRCVNRKATAPFPGRVVLTMPGLAWLDSLKVEDGGKLCIGTLLAGGITVFDPAGGETDFLPVGMPVAGSRGDPFTSNLCFGGPDMRDVWITASATGKIYRGRWPRPGLKLAFND